MALIVMTDSYARPRPSGNSGASSPVRRREATFTDSDRLSSMPLMMLSNSQEALSVLHDHTSEDDEEDAFDSLLANMKHRPRKHSANLQWLPLICVASICVTVGFLAGYALFLSDWHDAMKFPKLLVGEASPKAPRLILDAVSPDSISHFLQNLTKKPHVAGTPEDLDQAQWLQSHFLKSGFDEVQIVPYDVLLSFPDDKVPNEIFIIGDDGEVAYSINDTQPPLYPGENVKLPTFNAYSGNGQVQASLVYVNYGQEVDFQYLRNNNVQIHGNIVLARMGKIFRSNIVKFAEENNAKGVILFLDPKDYGPQGQEGVYPQSVYLPPFGAQSGTVKLTEGDPLTPHFPATDTAYRIPEENASLPRIPVQPIGYRDALELFRIMTGTQLPPKNFTGGLNCTYELGPSRTKTVRMQIQTSNQRRTTYNVIAVLHGQVEPDRYVILGNHRDAWTFGGVDPSSGTAALMELGRVFGLLKKEHAWRPRRSIVVCSWGAEEYGLVGSIEWTEDMRKLLDARAVAYLNVDMTMSGNVTLMGRAVPLLYSALFEAAKKVDNPNKAEYDKGMKSVYDSWLHHMPDKVIKSRPEVHGLGSGSDYVGFIHNLGISSLDITFVDPQFPDDTYPLYHTLYDTYHLVKDLMDVGFHRHMALTKVWGTLACDLADSLIMPFNATEYAAYLNRSFEAIEEKLGSKLKEKGVSLDNLEKAIQKFSYSAIEFQTTVLPQVDKNNPLAVRAVNDQFMLLERNFINPWGLPMGRDDVNHVVFAPSRSDSYAGVSFAGLWDLLHNLDTLSEDDQKKRLEEVKKHLSEVIFYVKRAATVLKGDISSL